MITINFEWWWVCYLFLLYHVVNSKPPSSIFRAFIFRRVYSFSEYILMGSLLHLLRNRSSHQRRSIKKGALKISQNSQEDSCARVPVPKACNLWKKRLWHKSFPENFTKSLRTHFLQNTSGWLLLQKCSLHCP